jgi:site-specific DNA recombinase
VRSRRIAAARTRKIVGYVRVSTDEQATNGVSLADQEARIRAYAVAQAWTLDEVIVDSGASAKTLQRPGIARLLNDVRAGDIATVVVVKLDRLTRSTQDLGELLALAAKHDVALVSISESLDTSSAAGRMVVNMLGVVAQWEREAIAERTASALGHKRSLRKVYSHAPFGYQRVDDNLVADDREQSALAEMRRMDAAGASYRAIGEMLVSRRILPTGRRALASRQRAFRPSFQVVAARLPRRLNRRFTTTRSRRRSSDAAGSMSPELRRTNDHNQFDDNRAESRRRGGARPDHHADRGHRGFRL